MMSVFSVTADFHADDKKKISSGRPFMVTIRESFQLRTYVNNSCLISIALFGEKWHLFWFRGSEDGFRSSRTLRASLACQHDEGDPA